METAEALAAPPDEHEGSLKEEAGEAGEAAAQSHQQQQQERQQRQQELAGGLPPSQEQEQGQETSGRPATQPGSVQLPGAHAGGAAANGPIPTPGQQASSALVAPGTGASLPGSPPPVASPNGSREAAQPAPSLTALLQQPSGSGPAQHPGPHSAAEAATPGDPAATAALMGASCSGEHSPALAAAALPAGQEHRQQVTPTAVGLAAVPPTAGSATLPQQLLAPAVAVPGGATQAAPLGPLAMPAALAAAHPLQARLQLQAFPRGTGYVLRPVAVPIPPGSAAAGASCSVAGAAPGQPGMVLQLQPVPMQPAQLQHYQQLLKLQQQQMAAAAAAKQAAQQPQPHQPVAAPMGALPSAQGVMLAGLQPQVPLAAQQLQQQPQKAAAQPPAAQRQQQQAERPGHDDLVLPIVAQPTAGVSALQSGRAAAGQAREPALEAARDPAVDMLA